MNKIANYGATSSSIGLEEVVIASSSAVHKTAKELFGNVHQNLEDIVEYKNKITKGLLVLPLTSVSLAIGSGISFAVLGDFVSSNIFFSSIISTVFGLGTSLCFDGFYEKQKEIFLEGSELIVNFYNSFEEFKIDPKILKINDLFLQFEKMHQCNCFDCVSGDDLVLFKSTGKLLLMDAIVKIFEEKKIDSSLILEWNKFLSSSKEFDMAKLWQTIKVEKPEESTYNQFFQQRKQFKSIEITEKIVNCFKEMIEKY